MQLKSMTTKGRKETKKKKAIVAGDSGIHDHSFSHLFGRKKTNISFAEAGRISMMNMTYLSCNFSYMSNFTFSVDAE